MNPLSKLEGYGPVVVGMATLVLFAACLVLAYVNKDTASQQLLVGAVVGMASTAVNYYMGSSKSSQTKDATIATMATNTAPVVPTLSTETTK